MEIGFIALNHSAPSCEVVAEFSAKELQEFRDQIHGERFQRGGILVGSIALTLFSPIKPQMLTILKAPYELILAAWKGRGMTSVAVKTI